MLPTPKGWFQGFVTNWFCYQIIVAAVTIANKELQKNNLLPPEQNRIRTAREGAGRSTWRVDKRRDGSIISLRRGSCGVTCPNPMRLVRVLSGGLGRAEP